MLTGIQYYRPPFPETRCWADDLSAIRDSGLGAIQLWLVWGWILSITHKSKIGWYPVESKS